MEQKREKNIHALYVVIAILIITIIVCEVIIFYFINQQNVVDNPTETIGDKLNKLVYQYYYVFWDKNSISDLSNREKQLLGIMKYSDDNRLDIRDVENISASEMENSLNSLFTNKMSINHQNIIGKTMTFPCTHMGWVYDDATKSYASQYDAHGIDSMKVEYYYITNEKEDNNNYTISIKYRFSFGNESTGPFYEIYGTYDDAIKKTNSLYKAPYTVGNEQNLRAEAKKHFDNDQYILDEMTTYTFTFVKENNNYKLSDFSKN